MYATEFLLCKHILFYIYIKPVVDITAEKSACKLKKLRNVLFLVALQYHLNLSRD